MSSAAASSITVRPLSTQQEFQDAVRLQKEIWGFNDIELLPVRLFVVATKVGGQAFGAFDGGNMIGFCLAIPGLKANGESYLHSHMLGVTREYRDSGIGRMLKLRQREDALARSIDLVEWTFDPLEIKNAYFNMERLGAVVRRYVRNQYGTTTSHLHGGLPTDRCIAEWWVASPRVRSLVAGGPPVARPETIERIIVPVEIAELRHTDPRRARQIQQAISAKFEEYFDRGLAVFGVERSRETGAYLLGRLDPAQIHK
ncbi:MAG TPA: GNAT family N-acetyltransferase [Bryobacteraceae bacterium]|nr:GNAT family N-acetyltransferase [Bryobacteraceae bacterium]